MAEWEVKNATKVDYQRFAKAELEVFGRATFGWAYWTLKNVRRPWSLQWMIQNEYISLLPEKGSSNSSINHHHHHNS